MKKLLSAALVSMAFLLIPSTALASQIHLPKPSDFFVQENFHSVNHSKISGFVAIIQKPDNKGTDIHIFAFGLTPNHQYKSLYYGNSDCHLEPYSANDVIGGTAYTASLGGFGHIKGMQEDNLDDINSISIRDANTFQLLACAVIHPGH